MLKVLKNLKKSFWSVVVIVILLCIQAATDLALPDYTSKIVNVGIQAGGIESAVPEVMAKEDMENLLLFSDSKNRNQKEDILNHYTLVGSIPSKQEEKIIHKYLGKEYQVKSETIYVLKEISKEEKDQLLKTMATPLMELTTVQNEETENQIKEQIIMSMPSNIPEAQKQAIKEQHLIELIKNMPEEQRQQMLAQFTDKINNMQDSIKEQAAVGAVKELYKNSNIEDFSKLPEDRTVVAKFASLFKKFNEYLEAVKIQGFKWNKLCYKFVTDDKNIDQIKVNFDETTYLILVQRYKEIPSGNASSTGGGEDIPYDLVGYITEIDTERIDSNYMNSRFEKYLKLIRSDEASEERTEQALNELHKSFATLSQEEQKYANIFLHDVQSGDVFIEEGKTLRDYITEYQSKAKNDQIHRFADTIGIDEEKLRNMMDLKLTEININEFGRLDEIKDAVDKSKAKAYFESKEGMKLNPAKVNIKVDKLIRKFILKGDFEMD